MNSAQLQKLIERYFSAGPAATGDPSAMDVFVEFRNALERGEVRSASPDAAAPQGWRVNVWVKQGILLGFRMGALTDLSVRRRSASSTRTPIPFARPRAPTGCASCRAARRSATARSRARRGLHAADVHQRGRIRRRGDDDRQSRTGGLVRADRQASAPVGRGADRRRARAGRRHAGNHRGRRAGGRRLRRVRRDHRARAARCWRRGRFSRAPRRCTIW